MKINDDHMFHGAALTQIAEHDLFTSINAVRVEGRLSRSAFRVNERIGIYIKYAAKPVGADYNFTFSKENKEELKTLGRVCDSVYIAMICVQDRHICCITLDEFYDWVTKREHELGQAENVSTMLVNLPDGKAFRVNMNKPARRKTYLDHPQLVARKRFPGALFEQ